MARITLVTGTAGGLGQSVAARLAAFPRRALARRTHCFVWSVFPALLAWSAFLFSPMLASLLLVTGFLAHYWQDRLLVAASHLPTWYLPLRFRLTTVACLCLMAGAFAETS